MSLKKKIAIFTSSFLPVPGGLQYETAWLLESLDKHLGQKKYKDLKFYFLAPNTEALAYCNYKYIKAINLNLNTSRFKWIKNLARFRSITRKENFDLIHCHGIIPDGLLIYINNMLSLRKTKYAITSHGEDLVVIPEIGYGYRLKLSNNMLAKLILKKVEKHILPSTAIIKFAREAGTRPDKIKVLPNGVKKPTVRSSEKLLKKIRKENKIQDNDLCLLSLSGMRSIKDLNSLIEGFRLARKHDTNLKLLLACEGVLITKLKDRVKKLGLENCIRFIGFISGERKDAYFRICDVFCMTSLFENFPISILEAMSYGKLVLATNVGGISDFVENNKNGILVNPKSPRQIAQVIDNIYHNKLNRKKIQKNAIITSENYNIDKIAQMHLELYLELLK